MVVRATEILSQYFPAKPFGTKITNIKYTKDVMKEIITKLNIQAAIIFIWSSVKYETSGIKYIYIAHPPIESRSKLFINSIEATKSPEFPSRNFESRMAFLFPLSASFLSFASFTTIVYCSIKVKNIIKPNKIKRITHNDCVGGNVSKNNHPSGRT